MASKRRNDICIYRKQEGVYAPVSRFGLSVFLIGVPIYISMGPSQSRSPREMSPFIGRHSAAIQFRRVWVMRDKHRINHVVHVTSTVNRGMHATVIVWFMSAMRESNWCIIKNAEIRGPKDTATEWIWRASYSYKVDICWGDPSQIHQKHSVYVNLTRYIPIWIIICVVCVA